MSNTLAPAPANTAAPAPGDTGTPPPADAPPQRTAEDLAAEAAATAADADSDAANGDAPKPGGRAESRIKELLAEKTAAMEWGEYWRQQATSNIKPAPGAPAAEGAPAAPKARPQLKDFADADKWAEALGEWTEDQVSTRVGTALTTAEQRRSQVSATEAWQARCETYRASAPDFDIVTRNPSLPVSSTMASAIMAEELGPAIFHHLGKNPTEAARIARLSPAQQVAAVGKIAGRLEAAPKAPVGKAPPAKQQSRAPDPPTPNRPGGAVEVNLANCALDEYLAKRLPQIARGGSGKR